MGQSGADIFQGFLSDIKQVENDNAVWDILCDTINQLQFCGITYIYHPHISNKFAKTVARVSPHSGILDFANAAQKTDLNACMKDQIQKNGAVLNFEKTHRVSRIVVNNTNDVRQSGPQNIFSQEFQNNNTATSNMQLFSDNFSAREFDLVTSNYGPALSSIMHISHTRLHAGMLEHSRDGLPHLSNRQSHILSLLISGKKYKQIAFQLGISENTVAFHMSEVRKKLDCANTPEVFATTYRSGLIDVINQHH